MYTTLTIIIITFAIFEFIADAITIVIAIITFIINITIIKISSSSTTIIICYLL